MLQRYANMLQGYANSFFLTIWYIRNILLLRSKLFGSFGEEFSTVC